MKRRKFLKIVVDMILLASVSIMIIVTIIPIKDTLDGIVAELRDEHDENACWPNKNQYYDANILNAMMFDTDWYDASWNSNSW